MATSIAFFNNKGGVGKTTLACNFAHYLSSAGISVTVVDCDPQSNATQLLLEDAAWEGLYEDRSASDQRTVLWALRHIRAGDSGVDADVELQRSRRFRVDVLAGHPSLSTIEDRLSTSWQEFGNGYLGGARRTLWARELVAGLTTDVVIFDLGPSLGALNRSVLMGSNYFVTPVAADLFSLYALENIGDWLQGWVRQYAGNYARLDATVEQRAEYNVPDELPVANGWAGYSVQQYVAKRSGGQIREVKAYDRYKKMIPERAGQLHEVQAATMRTQELGIVPNMFSMVPMAQTAHAPIADLTPADGVRGAQVTQQKNYVEQLDAMFARLRQNLAL
ncbi:ParA family protein [Curtobacterium flaccumfaciens]|uniref:ParA family protein n=1 Tax=Curtobacterium flaccumfaciens TaxID=2035 RepID=UPI0024A85A87|nr:ParA family protein [Curtobacterium flaccumfaciens]